MRSTVWRAALLALVAVVAVVSIAVRTSQLRAESLRNAVLTDSPCPAPCWQGITPGQPMTKEDVIERVGSLPLAEGVRSYELTDPERTIIDWGWKSSVGQNSISLADGQVAVIDLAVDFPLEVGEVVARYGVPEVTDARLAGVPESQYVEFDLFYPTRGLEFVVKLEGLDNPPLTPDSKVIVLVYWAPADSLQEWLTAADRPGLSNPRPWPGYGVRPLTTPTRSASGGE